MAKCAEAVSLLDDDTANRLVEMSDSGMSLKEAAQKLLQKEEIDLARLDKEIVAQGGKVIQESDISETQQEAEIAEPVKSENLEDFGEKLGGARKDIASFERSYSELTDEKLKSEPLSKIFPLNLIDKTEDVQTAALMKVARDEIPAKPRTGRRIEAWTKKVREYMGAINALGGRSDLLERMRKPEAGLTRLADKLELLTKIDRSNWKRIGAVSDYSTAYRLGENGEEIPAPYFNVWIDNKREGIEGKTVSDIVDAVNEKLKGEVEAQKMQFEVRGYAGVYYINKKGDPEKRKLKTFSGEDGVKQARKFIRENYDDLAAEWEAVKERDNVKKSDVRSKTNTPRTGKDHRQGKDVTPELFTETFGFRGVEFGNWVKQGKKGQERQSLLNATYDGLMDLANILNIPTKAISLNGSLGLGLGSRGRGGGAAAHFEPGTVIINLTKPHGSGSLAHEWFHALDNYFSRSRNGEVKKKGLKAAEAYRHANYITYQPEPMMRLKDHPASKLTKAQLDARRKQHPESGYFEESRWEVDPDHPKGVRPEVETRFAELVETLDASPMNERSQRNDKGPDGYWGRIIERGARAFENYIIYKMEKEGYKNGFLANVVPVDGFARNKDRYPYLLPEEITPVEQAFDELFSELKTKETDKGIALYSKQKNNTKSVAKLTGEEIPVTGAGMVADVRKYFQKQLQGKVIKTEIGDVRITGKSWDKLRQGIRSNPVKGELIPSIPKILTNGVYTGESELTKKRNDDIVKFHYFDGNVDLAGDTYSIRLSVGEDARGNLLYNLVEVEANKKGSEFTPVDSGGPEPFKSSLNDDLNITILSKNGAVNRLSTKEAEQKLAENNVLSKAIESGLLKIVESGEEQGFYKGGIAYVVADNNTLETLEGTAWHELTHAAMNDSDFLNSGVRQKLLKRLENMHKLGSRGKSQFWSDVNSRVDNAETAQEHVLDEVAGYAVTEYLLGNKKLPAGIVKFAQDFIAAIKAMLFKFSKGELQLGKVTPQELIGITESYVSIATGKKSDTVSLASKQGYKGNNTGEAQEWLRAKEKGLDMSFTARMQRAKDMGYITSLDDAITADYKNGKITFREDNGSQNARRNASSSRSRTPAAFYHGTDSNVRQFELGHKNRYDNGWLGEGVYLAKSSDMAKIYADKKASRTGGSENVMSLMVNPSSLLKVPVSFKSKLQNADAQATKRLTEQAKSEGFDGIIIEYNSIESEFVLFNPQNIRSIHAAFDPEYSDSNNLLASKQKQSNVLYSKAAKEEIKQDINDSDLAKEFKAPFYKLWSEAKGASFGFLTLRQLSEVTSKVLPDIANKYMPAKQKMEVAQNEWRIRGGNILENRSKLKRGENLALGSVQHEATINSVDPSMERYVPRWTDETAERRIKVIRSKAERSATPTNKYVDEIKNIKQELAEEPKRQQVYNELRPRYLALSEEAKTVYRQQLKYHNDEIDERMRILEERLDREKMPLKTKGQLIAKLKEKFETAKLSAPYFPLARFGRFWVYSESNGERSFNMFESEHAQDSFIEQLKRDGDTVIDTGKSLKNLQSLDGVSASFIAEVEALIDSMGSNTATEKLKDEIYQLYLETLPDISARKHFIHRKKVSGFHKDQHRAFANHVEHSSGELARLEFGHELSKIVNDQEDKLKLAQSSHETAKLQSKLDYLETYLADTEGMKKSQIESKYRKLDLEDPDKARWQAYIGFKESLKDDQVDSEIDRLQEQLESANAIRSANKQNYVSDAVSELRQSHDALMKPNSHWVASTLNSLGFTWFLGLTPAAAIVNLTQTPTVALPLAGAKYGFSNVAKEMSKATKQFFTKGNGKLSIENSDLSENEQAAFREWYASGLLDRTLAHDLAGMAESGIDNGTFKHKFMNVVSFSFHHAERLNREVTALSVYRAARKKGESHNQAVTSAANMTWKSHFDYTSSNRARFMRGNVLRVVTQFKQYSQGITYLLVKTGLDWFKGDTPEVRAEARKALLGIVGMQTSIAGAFGLPVMGIILGAAQALEGVIGDDDDPRDVKAEIRTLLNDWVGKDATHALTKGLIDAYTPWSVHGRLGMQDLWLRTSDRELEGRDAAYDLLKAILGPQATILIENPLVAKQLANDGHWGRALEYMMPKAVKDALKTGRYAEEDYRTLRGEKYKDATFAEMSGQLLGFSSSEMADIYDQNTSIQNTVKRAKDRRRALIDAMVRARQGDGDKREIQQEIDKWNKKNPNARISRATINRSIKARGRRSENVVDGVYVDKQMRGIQERYQYTS